MSESKIPAVSFFLYSNLEKRIDAACKSNSLEGRHYVNDLRPYRQLNPTIFIICRWVTAGEPCPKEGETKPNRGNEFE